MTDTTPPATPEPTPTPHTAATPEPAAAPYASPYTAGVPAAKSPILSILSLVAGIIGILGFAIVFIPFIGSFLQLFFPAAAIVLGALGKKKEPAAPKGLWLTGIITGIIGIVIAVIAVIGWALLVATAGTTYNY